MKRVFVSVAALLAVTFTTAAQADKMSPGNTYLAFLKALAEAKKPEDVDKFFAAKQLEKFSKLSAKDKKMGFGFSKIIIEAQKDLKIDSEKITGSQAKVVIGLCSEGKKGTTTVQLALENGTWKVGDQHTMVTTKKC